MFRPFIIFEGTAANVRIKRKFEYFLFLWYNIYSKVEKGRELMYFEEEIRKNLDKRLDANKAIYLEWQEKLNKSKDSIIRTITCSNCGAAVLLKDGLGKCQHCNTYYARGKRDV